MRRVHYDNNTPVPDPEREKPDSLVHWSVHKESKEATPLVAISCGSDERTPERFGAQIAPQIVNVVLNLENGTATRRNDPIEPDAVYCLLHITPGAGREVTEECFYVQAMTRDPKTQGIKAVGAPEPIRAEDAERAIGKETLDKFRAEYRPTLNPNPEGREGEAIKMPNAAKVPWSTVENEIDLEPEY